MRMTTPALALCTALLLMCVAGCSSSTRGASASDKDDTTVTPGPIKGPSGTRTALIPPAVPGRSVTRLEGCLVDGTGDDQDGARFPVPAPTRGVVIPETRVNATGTGIVVSHELAHACCLKAVVTSRVQETDGATPTARVRVKLHGEPCRCMCRSTVKAAVGLQEGDYTLIIETEEQGTVKTTYEGPVTVGVPTRAGGGE